MVGLPCLTLCENNDPTLRHNTRKLHIHNGDEPSGNNKLFRNPKANHSMGYSKLYTIGTFNANLRCFSLFGKKRKSINHQPPLFNIFHILANHWDNPDWRAFQALMDFAIRLKK